jgi:sodium-dependent dicarboxylate transporter 2/3/5
MMNKSRLEFYLKLIAGPLIALICKMLNPFGVDEHASNTISIGLWMITWWILESIPMPAVALMPLLLFPILNISNITQTAEA